MGLDVMDGMDGMDRMGCRGREVRGASTGGGEHEWCRAIGLAPGKRQQASAFQGLWRVWGRNPVGVGNLWGGAPKVGLRASGQPWARRRNPVGIGWRIGRGVRCSAMVGMREMRGGVGMEGMDGMDGADGIDGTDGADRTGRSERAVL